MTRLEFLKKNRQHILNLAKKHGAQNVRIFGSVLRKEETKESDIDMLIHLEAGRTYFDVIHLKQDLEEELSFSVDLVLDTAIKPIIRDKILDSAEPL